MPTQSHRRKVTVSSMPGPWTKGSDFEGKGDVTKVREYGGGPKVALPGEVEKSDVTVTRLYDAARDADLVAQLNTDVWSPFEPATITDTAFDAAGSPIGRPIILAGCTVVGWKLSGSDANDEKPSELEVMFAVPSK